MSPHVRHLVVLTLAVGVALLAPRVASCAEPPERPEAPADQPSDCPVDSWTTHGGPALDLKPGQALPAELLDDQGLLRCRVVLVAPWRFRDLLDGETWGSQVADLYRLDTGRQELELSWYQGKVVELSQPAPWWERPAAQRWGGRLEVIAVVAVTAYGLHAVGSLE